LRIVQFRTGRVIFQQTKQEKREKKCSSRISREETFAHLSRCRQTGAGRGFAGIELLCGNAGRKAGDGKAAQAGPQAQKMLEMWKNIV
jgi:hypothetical protein